MPFKGELVENGYEAIAGERLKVFLVMVGDDYFDRENIFPIKTGKTRRLELFYKVIFRENTARYKRLLAAARK